MSILETILFGCILIGIILVPILFVIRLLMAIFSQKEREKVRKHWLLHIVWAVCAVILPLTIITGDGLSPTTAARRAWTVNMMSNVQTAIQAYQTEYGVSPPEDSNAELAADLQGNNPRKIPFLALRPQDANTNGEILDAWGTPLRITVNQATPLGIQSAGPDKIWNTKDDLPPSSDNH